MIENYEPSENDNKNTKNDLEDAEPIIGDKEEHALSFIVQKLLLSTLQVASQRHVLFRTKCTIQGKVCDVIINNVSTKNIISKALVKILNLPPIKHLNPYKNRWIKKKKVQEVCKVLFSIGKFLST